jgi:methylated-DNA-protein-cysteine methyltransferase-like protein
MVFFMKKVKVNNMAQLDEDFLYQVLEVTSEIPKGKVATYGQIARLIGKEKNARLVGRALQVSSLYADGYPCHRVVNSSGRLVPRWDKQQTLLLEEGVFFKQNGDVDLKRCQWNV